jgi:hypothetical protein
MTFRNQNEPENGPSVWHVVVFVGMFGVLHMPTRTLGWRPNSISILNINNEDAAAGAVEVSSRGRWIFVAAWSRGDENGLAVGDNSGAPRRSRAAPLFTWEGRSCMPTSGHCAPLRTSV